MSNPLYIPTAERIAIQNPWDATQVQEIDLRAGDTPVFNLFFCDKTFDARAPYAIRRYASAAITMQLLDAAAAAAATQSTWTELVPAATSPVITHVQAGSATRGQYDAVTLPSPIGSGFITVTLSG